MNRPLTTVERTFLALGERIVMNPVVMVRCRGALEPATVERAIVAVQRRQPALQVRLVRADPPWFASTKVPDAALRVVERRDAEHWRELVQAELNDPFDQERGPLIRFVLVRGAEACELICTTDHLNADGRSGLFVLRDVLGRIADPDLRLVPLEDRACFDEHLPGGLWDLGRTPRAVRGIIADHTRTLATVARGFMSERARIQGRTAAPAPGRDRPTIEFVHRRLSPDRTQALVEACRAHATTVQGALMVAASHALAHARGLYDRGRPRARARIGCIAPIDIRSALTPAVGDHFGIFAWAPTTVQALAPGANFWALADRNGRRLRTLRGQPALAGLRRLLDVQELIHGSGLEQLSALAVRGCDAMITVSNLGRLELPRRLGEVDVESFGFFAMIPDGDAVVAIQTLDELELNYCYCEHQIPSTVVHALADGVMAILDAATGEARRGAAESLEF
jgi:hypothetical protein